MKLTLSFSPCPNDTFIFDALVNHHIDTEGLEFEVLLEDVQTLNEWTQHGRPDISKISYGVLPLVLDRYELLYSGGALGKGVGPLLISAAPLVDGLIAGKTMAEYPVAIPGKNTTAHFLFSLAYPRMENKVFTRFDEIEGFVASGEGLGVIIHENRFTYRQKGLFLVQDLGDYWENQTGNPIPLGGIVMRRSLPIEVREKVDRLIRKSLDYAFVRYPAVSDYVKDHAREMNPAVMLQHIDLYVNEYSLNLGIKGRQAVMLMLQTLAGKTFEESAVFAGEIRQ